MATSELKAWAKENFKGLETCTIPSFTRDLTELDEEGIRWDVQQSIKHGFFSTLCACEIGLTFEEAKRFVEIVADEAKDKILVSTTLMFNSFDQIKEMLQYAKKVGCHNGLLFYPPNYFPQTEDDLFQATKELCDASDLGIVLYTTHKLNFERLYPSGFSPELLSRMADIDTVVGLKIGSNDFAYISECFQKCGDRILVNSPIAGLAPMLHKAYGQQWIGAAVYEMYQSPEKPYLVDYFNLILQGETEKAMGIMRRLTPAVGIFESQLMPTILLGAYHWLLLKYYQWLVGGNGGCLRHPVLRTYGQQLQAARMAITMLGITPREPDEEFFIGRMNYAKMKK